MRGLGARLLRSHGGHSLMPCKPAMVRLSGLLAMVVLAAVGLLAVSVHASAAVAAMVELDEAQTCLREHAPVWWNTLVTAARTLPRRQLALGSAAHLARLAQFVRLLGAAVSAGRDPVQVYDELHTSVPLPAAALAELPLPVDCLRLARKTAVVAAIFNADEEHAATVQQRPH